MSLMNLKKELSAVMHQRDILEQEAKLISERLQGPGMPGLSSSLLDKEQGFPRADIDVAAVRSDRHRLVCLSNDHQALSLKLEQLISQLHAAACEAKAQDASELSSQCGGTNSSLMPLTRALDEDPAVHSSLQPPQDPAVHSSPQPPHAAETTTAESSASKDAETLTQGPSASIQPLLSTKGANLEESTPVAMTPFAVVDEISAESPASSAGLQVGDRLCDFGGINTNGSLEELQGGILQRVGQLVAMSDGRAIPLTVLRLGLPVRVEVTPRRWKGRGLLG
ncbi:hypothetical protein CEUSTIGMA_g9219.t1 [Chlamydomonas eustigma]|uniref:26S proteasome non-ATPase regulatory subunit 9 n=1 Tax=Chlamydomonas eustigma TaxID=1157962 RepID=A0A250XFD7_9CHLO|nr:hypothetical protein CEUSTIGMA_g9219.t1 [Chlamydomonas eustigma]|eukprot:GAX81791.1 hypothetical protein CEUSTIGMA_g9219.t1 [Chlamydomonas eustigma]